ncbi:hypothetical protein [Nocardia abscessus]|uniref:hypothetical protein n=1 Tax=Nocardia abscessus TaxID=120957 RepID=UPI00245492B4|nr:hypothetical protein [Nocardia abscessus]
MRRDDVIRLPADPDTVKRYLSLAADRDDIAPSTVSLRVRGDRPRPPRRRTA